MMGLWLLHTGTECEAFSFASEGTWTMLAEFLEALLMSLHRTV